MARARSAFLRKFRSTFIDLGMDYYPILGDLMRRRQSIITAGIFQIEAIGHMLLAGTLLAHTDTRIPLTIEIENN